MINGQSYTRFRRESSEFRNSFRATRRGGKMRRKTKLSKLERRRLYNIVAIVETQSPREGSRWPAARGANNKSSLRKRRSISRYRIRKRCLFSPEQDIGHILSRMTSMRVTPRLTSFGIARFQRNPSRDEWRIPIRISAKAINDAKHARWR